jgi:hypothetical protein
MMLIVCFRLRYMTTKTMQGRMRLLHWEDKLQPELMFSVPSMIDSKRFYSSFFNCHYSYYYFSFKRWSINWDFGPSTLLCFRINNLDVVKLNSLIDLFESTVCVCKSIDCFVVCVDTRVS